MVKEEYITKYQCPYCDNEYNREETANECRDRCFLENAEEVQEKNTTLYECEYCNHKFNQKHKSQACEYKHIKNKDNYYYDYLDAKEMQKLKLASNHKDQKKLIIVK